MNKLQYDSYYKFLVSAGIILIVFPIIALGFFFNSELLIISQNEYDNLSEYSLRAIGQKEDIWRFVINIFPCVVCILLVFGFFLLVYGCYRWSKIQKQLDDQVISETIIKKINAKKMSTGEVILKAEKEIYEMDDASDNSGNTGFDTGNTDSNFGTSDSNNSNTGSGTDDKSIDSRYDNIIVHSTKGDFPVTPHLKRVARYLDIEHLCYLHVENQYGKIYDLQKNIKIVGVEYDCIGVSKRKTKDILFEFKYLENCPSNTILSYMLYQFNQAGIHYKNNAHRKYKSILIIVTPKKYSDIGKSKINQCLEELSPQNKIEIQYLIEEDLFAQYDNTKK